MRGEDICRDSKLTAKRTQWTEALKTAKTNLAVCQIDVENVVVQQKT